MPVDKSVTMIDHDKWFEIFRFFESRKALRFYGGKKGGSKNSPALSLATLLLWIIVFGLANIVVKENSLTFVFQDISSVSDLKVAYFLGNVSLNVLSLLVIIISVLYGIGKIIVIQFGIMVVSTIVVLSLRSQSGMGIDEASLQLAILVVTFVTCSLLADVLIYYMWVGFLLGPLFRWMKHSDDLYASSIFPYGQVIVFCLLLIILLPLWVPILASYVLVLLLQVVGVVIVNRSVLEFLILNKKSYEIFECVAVEEITPGIFNVKFDYRLKEIITWRFWKFNRLPTSRFTYEGQLDGDGTPSGAGKWMDTVHGGEILTGHWRAGRPVAPYQSQEQRPNGGAFSANSLAFLNLGSLHRVGFSTEFRGPQFGRAGVECGRSGAFYAGFPEARLETLPNFEAMMSASLAGRPLSRVNVLIYICGFNNSCEGASKMLGQMLALSSYPSDFLPIVFAWPGGNIPSYFQAKAVCESQRLEDEFVTLVSQLQASGLVSRIDVIGHSQGCRFLAHCFAKPGMRSLNVNHLVLISPEADLEDFERDGEAICGSIHGTVTIYAHPGDMALFWAQIFNSLGEGTFKRSVGRRSEPIVSRSSGKALDMDIIDTTSLASNVEELHHSFFYLSREMLWDIQSLLVDGHRAKHRPLLIERGDDQCYNFCSVPPAITSIF